MTDGVRLLVEALLRTVLAGYHPDHCYGCGASVTVRDGFRNMEHRRDDCPVLLALAVHDAMRERHG